MSKTPVKTNRQIVKCVWDRGHRNVVEISKITGVPLRSCERYVSLLKKTGHIPKIRKSGRPRKITSVMRRQLGRIIQKNCYKTAAEMKTALEKKHPDLDVTERTVRNELSRLGYAAVLPKRVPLLTKKAKEIRLKWAALLFRNICLVTKPQLITKKSD